MEFAIVGGVILWYLTGLLGSAVALGSIRRNLDEMFPQVDNEDRADRVIGFLFAIFGPFNLGGALIFAGFSKVGFRPSWHWF